MGKQEKRVLTLDRYEHGVVVNALNEMDNDPAAARLFFSYACMGVFI